MGFVRICISQEMEGPPMCDYETCIGMESIGYAIIDALEEGLASSYHELTEFGVIP
jgi:hypothetical protein